MSNESAARWACRGAPILRTSPSDAGGERGSGGLLAQAAERGGARTPKVRETMHGDQQMDVRLAIAEENAASVRRLPFDDRQDFADAARGFVGSIEDGRIP
ncbi:hypothetical protein ACH41H_46935 [Streptomyces sp. NPDC020800]|uniref:hypothetical protein n=1 Tax=Streptomyces sp. NPDC020800 TaxID=3365092 RepID=UPI00379D26CB